jgi:hypothetical protein
MGGYGTYGTHGTYRSHLTYETHRTNKSKAGTSAVFPHKATFPKKTAKIFQIIIDPIHEFVIFSSPRKSGGDNAV